MQLRTSLTADGFNLEADLFGSVSRSELKSTEIPIKRFQRRKFFVEMVLGWPEDSNDDYEE